MHRYRRMSTTISNRQSRWKLRIVDTRTDPFHFQIHTVHHVDDDDEDEVDHPDFPRIQYPHVDHTLHVHSPPP